MTRRAGWKTKLITTIAATAALTGRSDKFRMLGILASGWNGRRASAAVVVAINVIVGVFGGAAPAAADDLVGNLHTVRVEDVSLSEFDVVQAFTTGSNASGYRLESISIDFSGGAAIIPGSDNLRSPVYVYLHEDNGNGRPNHAQGGQVAVLTKDGVTYAGPRGGVNKYKVWKARCYPQPPHGGGCLSDASSVHLDPNTTYWVYVWAGESDTTAAVGVTGNVQTGAAGWTIADGLLQKPQHSGYGSYAVNTCFVLNCALHFKVEGTTNPEVLVSVSDVTVTEGIDATADFVVSLSRKASGPVQVSYETLDLSVSSAADEGSDYEATSGTLTFRPGKTRKTVSVPILDDARNEGNETFGLVLTDLQGATFDDNSGTGTIVNAEPLALSISDATATEGVDDTIDFTVSLNRATTRRITVNVLFSSSTADFSDITDAREPLVFEPGETVKTYSLGIVDDSVNEPSETFSMVLQVPGFLAADLIVGSPGIGTILNTETLTASFENVPQDHDGSTAFTFNVAFTSDVSIGPAAMRDHAFTVTNGDVTGASRVDGRSDRWLITVDPDGDDAVTITLPGNRACGTQGAICSDEDNPVQLSNSPSATVAAPPEGDPLTASFSNVPDSHDGGDFFVDLTFSEGPDVGYRDVQKAVKVSGGSINRANRKTKGSNVGWTLKVRPTGTDSLTIRLPATTTCSARGAICTTDDRRLTNSPSATVAGPAAVVETTPTASITGGSGTEGDDDSIAFTVTLDEAASGTVTVNYATSDGSAEAGDDYTAKSGTLSFAAGETSKTIAVAIEDDSENERDETFTVTLSSASGADLGTSSATGTIRNRYVAPLTASFSNVPAEHDGTAFTFDLGFSENVKTGYARVRDDAFTVSGATIEKAKRKTQGSNQNWTITVKPLGSGRISFTLPATTNCDDDGAICTHDERTLSHSTSDTVLGPVGISIADGEVVEGANVVLAFAVALTRAASSQLTVDYATSDGTATAGADYTSTSGTLTIDAGRSSGSIQVPVLDDEHNEGSETFTVTLSNASSGDLTDASATGTITNHDALPKALVARIGRTAAVHIVDQVEERVNAPRAPGFDGRVAGRQINRNMGQDVALEFLQQLGGGAAYGQHHGHPDGRRNATGGTDPRFGTGGMTSSLGPQPGIRAAMNPNGMHGRHPGGADEGGMRMGLGGEQLLGGSSFTLNRATSSGGVLSFWSRSAQSQFSGQDGALALNGDVRSTMVGADYATGRLVTGVSLAHTRGLGSYAGVDTGRMTSAVTGLYPWIGYKASERVTVWTVAGYGAGGLMLRPGAGAPIETGLSMAMAAGGGRGQILGGGDGFGLAFKADALWVGTRTTAATGPGGNLASTRATVSRLRTAIEGSQRMSIASRMALTPSIEIGIRQDGGDADTGRGMDLGAGLVLADSVTGLAVDIRVRRLLVHEAEGFAESGLSISVSYNPTPSTPLGFTARVSPAWGGDAMSGAEALWGRESMGGMDQNALRGAGGNRLDTEVGYGLAIGSRFVGTPTLGVGTSADGRDYRLGYRLGALGGAAMAVELGVDAQRRERPLQGGTDHGVIARATVRW